MRFLDIKAVMDLETFNRKIVPMRMKLMIRARQLTGDDAGAEDLVQEVMLKLWSMRGELERYACHEALAMTVLRNKCTDLWRRRKTVREHTAVMEPGREPAADAGREDVTDEVRLIGMIVDRLPPLQSAIFRMKEIEGYEADEIVKITGCTPDSLRQNLSRARRKIREEFLRLTTR